MFVGETVLEPIDTTDWDTYQNKYYGFEIQHPDSWKGMSYKTASSKTALYDTVYKFRKSEEDTSSPYVGFDVVVYSVRKAPNPGGTDEIKKKDNILEDTDICQFSKNIILGDEGNDFQEISVKADNTCYEPTYFFSITKGNYLYNIIPVMKEGTAMPENPQVDVNHNFPEYRQVVTSFESIPIERAQTAVKKAPAKPRISAPRPVSAKVVNGQLVCAKKNDKPSKSNKNKPGHMDMECCLDPDETPNPWCTYSSPKYQKYLK
jgi:hypothetical protein